MYVLGMEAFQKTENNTNNQSTIKQYHKSKAVWLQIKLPSYIDKSLVHWKIFILLFSKLDLSKIIASST